VGFRLIGPPITEIYTLYNGKEGAEGIAKWAANPTPQKRKDYPPMLAIPKTHDELVAAGAYMLSIGAPKK
jgi:hypothetical protein